MILEDFLSWSAAQPERYEYIDDQPVLMTGSTQQRAALKADILTALHALCRGTGYRVYSSIHIVLPSIQEVRYPSIVVDAGPYIPDATEPSRPILIIDIGRERDWSELPEARYLYVPDDADPDTAVERAISMIDGIR
jgi:hypothetical protein